MNTELLSIVDEKRLHHRQLRASYQPDRVPFAAGRTPGHRQCRALGLMINCKQQQLFGDYKGSTTGIKGVLEQPLTAAALQQKLEAVLKHNVIPATPDNKALIRSIGIITGGANSEWRLAEEEQLDAYITGEISEHDWHESQEAGIHMFASWLSCH
ncbi:MAG: Nif3-like dinuclear metal center hexameric protein [Methylobacter sp.]|nr:Nif3-like dinuclear metal center hexameric protein [Methylobacter sp.]